MTCLIVLILSLTHGNVYNVICHILYVIDVAMEFHQLYMFGPKATTIVNRFPMLENLDFISGRRIYTFILCE